MNEPGMRATTGAAHQSEPPKSRAAAISPVPLPVSEIESVRALLSPYPHIARCPACISFALTYWDPELVHQVLATTLSFHDSSHRFDPWETGFYGF
jgi:hypothetical protein